jgi:protein-tyrosine-phosphatase
MEMSRRTRRIRRTGATLFAVWLVFAVSAGGVRGQTPEAQRAAQEVRAVLGIDRSTTEYLQARSRLEEMGPGLDPILIALVEDRRARMGARADALVLLADRRSPLALETLQRALESDNERLRSAAVLGLKRLAPTSPRAMELIREATEDRSRAVRMNAVQSLDVRQVEVIRELLERESDPQIREVANQLLVLAEFRGAPLEEDRRGVLRTAGSERDPQIVFRPFVIDSAVMAARGDLRVELPEGPDVPLAEGALVVGKVVPAFFAPDRTAVVVEEEGRILVVDLVERRSRVVGPGLAPRPIPFSNEFVFVRRDPEQPPGIPVGGELFYEVYRGSFVSDRVDRIGRLSAWIHPDLHGGLTPVRWMVVGEGRQGFVLRGDGIEPFALPTPVWSPGTAAERPR